MGNETTCNRKQSERTLAGLPDQGLLRVLGKVPSRPRGCSHETDFASPNRMMA